MFRLIASRELCAVQANKNTHVVPKMFKTGTHNENIRQTFKFIHFKGTNGKRYVDRLLMDKLDNLFRTW